MPSPKYCCLRLSDQSPMFKFIPNDNYSRRHRVSWDHTPARLRATLRSTNILQFGPIFKYLQGHFTTVTWYVGRVRVLIYPPKNSFVLLQVTIITYREIDSDKTTVNYYFITFDYYRFHNCMHNFN